jgi:hypothetical protein
MAPCSLEMIQRYVQRRLAIYLVAIDSTATFSNRVSLLTRFELRFLFFSDFPFLPLKMSQELQDEA